MSRLTKEDIRRDIIPVLAQIPTLGIIDNLDIHHYFSLYFKGETIGVFEIEDDGRLSLTKDNTKSYYTSTDAALEAAVRATEHIQDNSDIRLIALFEMAWRLENQIGLFRRHSIGTDRKSLKIQVAYTCIIEAGRFKQIIVNISVRDNKISVGEAYVQTIGTCAIEDPNVFEKLTVLINNHILRASKRIKDLVINQYNLIKDIDCEIST